MSSLVSTRESRLTLGVLAAIVTAFVAYQQGLDVPVVDDAGISAAFARTFASGHGLRLTPYSQVVEGFSNPTWTLLLAAVSAVGFDVLAATNLMGVLAAALALLVVASWPALGAGRALRLEDVAAAVLPCSVSSYVYWAGGGLEGPLLALALAVGGAATLHELREGGSRVSGVALGIVALTRPEGPVYVAALALVVLVIRGGRLERSDVGRVAIAAGMTLTYEFFRVGYFADTLPNTYYAKVGHDLGRYAYITSFAEAHEPAIALSAVAFGGHLLLRGRARGVALLALAFLCTGVFFAMYAGGDWMTEHRFLAPVATFLGTPLASLLARIRDEGASASPQGTAFRFVAALATAALAFSTVWEVRRHSAMLAAATFPCHFVLANAREVRRTTERLGLRHPRLAFTDIGGHALVLANADIVDSAGLADRVIAHTRGADTQAISDYILFDPPSILDAHGPGAGVLLAPGVAELYEPIVERYPDVVLAPAFQLLRGLDREHDPRCPDQPLSTRLDATLYRSLMADLESGHVRRAMGRYGCAFERSERVDAEGRSPLIERAVELAGEAHAVGDSRRAYELAAFATRVSSYDPDLRELADRYGAEARRAGS